MGRWVMAGKLWTGSLEAAPRWEHRVLASSDRGRTPSRSVGAESATRDCVVRERARRRVLLVSSSSRVSWPV